MRDADFIMRTTLDLDDDVLQAAKEIAQMKGKTAGQVVSELVPGAAVALTHFRGRRRA